MTGGMLITRAGSGREGKVSVSDTGCINQMLGIIYCVKKLHSRKSAQVDVKQQDTHLSGVSE